MPTLIHQRVRECRDGKYSKSICRVSSGWVVLGDVQFLPGYSLLLPDPVVANPNHMNEATRKTFFHEMSLVGNALLSVTEAVRINYEILGNLEPALHAHIFPRYMTEPEELRLKPVWFYDWDAAPSFNLDRDRSIMDAIHDYLQKRGLTA